MRSGESHSRRQGAAEFLLDGASAWNREHHQRLANALADARQLSIDYVRHVVGQESPEGSARAPPRKDSMKSGLAESSAGRPCIRTSPPPRT